MLRNVPPSMSESCWRTTMRSGAAAHKRLTAELNEKKQSSKARAYTYLCCKDGIHAAAVGGNGGGEPLHYRDVV